MLISIITVNYNDAVGLEKTIKSVQSQTYQDFEHIIIDGNSTDDSKDVIEKHKDSFSYWVSETDSGIYNAMNKGIKVAKGEYLLFLNSGDWLHDDEVLGNFILFTPIEDIVYGDVLITGRGDETFVKKMPAELNAKKSLNFTITHQAIFFKKNVFNEEFYDEKYAIIADWVFYNRALLIKKTTYKHIDMVITVYDGTGLSSKIENIEKREKERDGFYKEIAPFVIKELLINKKVPKKNKETNRLIIKAAKKIDDILIKIGI